MKKNVAAALAGALSLSLAAGVVAADKPVSSKAGVQKSAQGSCGAVKAGEGSCGASAVSKASEGKCGEGKCNGQEIQLVVFDFGFMGGSLASVEGEKIVRAIKRAIEKRQALIIVSASGGARMQESTFSLMQMSKTSAALKLLDEARLPYISILTDPTMGGVSASFAWLGDLIIAEPGALIGFAGQRVIKQTIGADLPEGFQRAEFLLEHGLIDDIVPRSEHKKYISDVVKFLTNNKAMISKSEVTTGNEAGFELKIKTKG